MSAFLCSTGTNLWGLGRDCHGCVAPLTRRRSNAYRVPNRGFVLVGCAQPVAEPPTEKDEPSSHDSESQEENVACEACGRAEGAIKGCDGSGRIAGGMGAVLDWWPIKAYRPCPELAKAKKDYKKSGQSLDEIAFGRK